MKDEQQIKARYRNKVGKIIIEVWNGDKWLYVKTLSNPLIEFKEECLAKVSLNKEEIENKEPEKFFYYTLNEPKKEDTKLEKDLLEKAKAAQNKIMKEMLK